MPIAFKTIQPPKMNTDAYRLEYLNALRKEGRKLKREYEKTVKTWKRKPEFVMEIGLTRKGSGEASVLVGTDNEIYGYLDDGTRVRHAVMSGDWRSKTSSGMIGSRAGRGRKVFVSRRIRRPGIKARRFSKTIAARREGGFVRAMRLANERATKKVYP